MKKSSSLAILTVVALLFTACRPPQEGGSVPTPSPISGDLKPSKQLIVNIHLPSVPDALAGSIVSAVSRDLVSGAGISLEIITPYSAADAFMVQNEYAQVNMFITTPSAAAVAMESGTDLVMIASLQRYASFQLIGLNSKKVSLASVARGRILIQGRPGDEAPLLALFDAAGINRGGIELVYQEPALPLNPAELTDGTYAAMLVNNYDGAARIQEYIDPATGGSLGPNATKVIAGIDGDLLAKAAGLGFWVQRGVLDDNDNRVALAIALIGIADGLAGCRDDANACALSLSDSALLDRYGEGVLWSVDQLNATLWPAPDGAFSLNDSELERALAQAVAVGLIKSSSVQQSMLDTSVLELVNKNIPASIDLIGDKWVPLEVQLPLE